MTSDWILNVHGHRDEGLRSVTVCEDQSCYFFTVKASTRVVTWDRLIFGHLERRDQAGPQMYRLKGKVVITSEVEIA